MDRDYVIRRSETANTIHKNIPTKLSIVNDIDCDILYIDDIIRKTIHNNRIIESRSLDDKLKGNLNQQEIAEIIKKKQYINSEATLYEYTQKVQDILFEYRDIKRHVSRRVFGTKHTDVPFCKLVSVIDRFLDIAKKYITLTIQTKNKEEVLICNTCEAVLNNESQDDDYIICDNCNAGYQLYISYKDRKDDIEDMHQRGGKNDDTFDNLYKTLTAIQGNQIIPNKETIFPTLYANLDTYFRERGRPTGAEVKLLPFSERVGICRMRVKTSISKLVDALSSIPGGSKQFCNLHLIAKEYWGWELISLHEHIESIRYKYNSTQAEFYKIDPDIRRRDSSPNTQLRAFFHLRLEGVTCYRDEFKIVDNSESVEHQSHLFDMMLYAASINFPCIVYQPPSFFI